MQSVLFAWLVTIVLRESAERVGFAQMSVLLPGLFLILIAGVLADRIGQKRQAIWSQMFAGVMPLFLILAFMFDALSYPVMIIYALLMGIAQAILTPARDGLLNLVAGENVQRMVMLSTLCQFGFQILGFTIAGFADSVGPILILSFQSVILLIGTWGYFQLGETGRPVVAKKDRETVSKGLWEGAATVVGNPVMRAVLIQNIAMGVFFMGNFIVAFPLVIREVFAGSSSDLAALNALNSLGVVLTVLVLLRVGYIFRAGRALIMAQGIGSLVLLSAGLVSNQIVFTSLVFVLGRLRRFGNAHVSHIVTAVGTRRPTWSCYEFLRFFVYGRRTLWRVTQWLSVGHIWSATSHCYLWGWDDHRFAISQLS